MFFSSIRNNLINNKSTNISGDEAYELISNNSNILILDVRNFDEFSYGHIPKAKNIPAPELMYRINEIKDYSSLPVIVYCASGNRSSIAVNILLKNNFTNIFNLYRGLKDWKYQIEYTAGF